MRIFVFTPYPIEGPSNRYRVLQYIPHFKKKGVQVTVRPFLTSAFYRVLYQKGNTLKKAWLFFKATLQRLKDVRDARMADIIFIHRECYPLGPPFIERLLTLFGKPIVYDFDDAIYLPTAQSRIRNWFKWHSKILKIISLSDEVIVCNEYLYKYAYRFNKHVTNIPTCLDTAACTSKRRWEQRKPLRIGWIGSHTTTKYLDLLVPVFKALAKRYDFELYIVGANKQLSIPGVNITQRPWELHREREDFQSLDIGVYPLLDDAWTVGKTGFKTVQFMAAGVPGVISDVGANRWIVQDGVNGFLVKTQKDWVERISRLIEDKGLREQIGRNGRRTVLEQYSVDVQLPRYLELFQKLLRPRIFHLISDLDIGGTEEMLATTLQHLPQRYNHTVCSIKPFGKVTDKVVYIENVRLISLMVSSKLNFLAIPRLFYYCIKERPLILQTYLYFDNLLGVFLGTMTRTPCIITGLRAVNTNESFLRTMFARLAFMLSDCTVSNSRSGTTALTHRYKIPAAKVILIRNGKDYSFAAEQKTKAAQERIRSRLHLSQHMFVATVVAKLREQKGHKYLLEAVARLPLELRINSKFLLVGDGPQGSFLKRYAAQMNISKQVIFLGDREDIADILLISDIFVMPSLWEGLPGAVMEAMAMGVAVLATDIPGTIELITDTTGFLVPPRDASALSDHILWLATHARERHAIGLAGKNFIMRAFTLQSMITGYDALYQRLFFAMQGKQQRRSQRMVGGS